MRHDRIEVDHPRDPLARLREHAGRDGAGIAVRDQDHVAQILVVQDVDDVA